MALHFLSRGIIDFRIDAQNSKAFGKVLINYQDVEEPYFVETAQVHVTCVAPQDEATWRIKRRLKKLAYKKLLRVDALFPQSIKNIFKV